VTSRDRTSIFSCANAPYERTPATLLFFPPHHCAGESSSLASSDKIQLTHSISASQYKYHFRCAHLTNFLASHLSNSTTSSNQLHPSTPPPTVNTKMCPSCEPEPAANGNGNVTANGSSNDTNGSHGTHSFLSFRAPPLH
jgi:hypothetical protein